MPQSYLEHCIYYLGEVLPEESRVCLCNLDEELKRLLRCALISGLQRVPDDCQLLRDGGLEFVPLCRLLQFLKMERMLVLLLAQILSCLGQGNASEFCTRLSAQNMPCGTQ